ncbi:MAG: hypothetical protein KC422_20345 [Trueperaceae bacterium]|nr:hypothetical protein [Trueperaceae bacterium]
MSTQKGQVYLALALLLSCPIWTEDYYFLAPV